MTLMNSNNSINPLDPELRSLILDYMTAYNNDDHDLANHYLSQIQERNVTNKLKDGSNT
jgi:hypothetical protein